MTVELSGNVVVERTDHMTRKRLWTTLDELVVAFGVLTTYELVESEFAHSTAALVWGLDDDDAAYTRRWCGWLDSWKERNCASYAVALHAKAGALTD